MKRDMDLVRDILLRIEEFDFFDEKGEFDYEFGEHSEGVVMNHLGLLWKAGYIEAVDASSMGSEEYLPKDLTWEGHEFLDAARNQTVWNDTKEAVTKYGGSVPLEVLKALLIKGASTYLGLG